MQFLAPLTASLLTPSPLPFPLPLPPGLGIGSDILRHLSDVSTKNMEKSRSACIWPTCI